MNSKEFSKCELVSILEAIELSTNCWTEEHLRQLMVRTKELVGADYSICALGTVPQRGGAEVVSLINGDYPEEWVALYTKEDLYKVDPVVRFHGRFCGTQLWSDTFRRYTDADAKGVINRAGDFGLYHGVSSGVSIPGTDIASIFSFGGSNNTFTEHQKKVVDVVTLHLHKAFVQICRGQVESMMHMDGEPALIQPLQ